MSFFWILDLNDWFIILLNIYITYFKIVTIFIIKILINLRNIQRLRFVDKSWYEFSSILSWFQQLKSSHLVICCWKDWFIRETSVRYIEKYMKVFNNETFLRDYAYTFNIYIFSYIWLWHSIMEWNQQFEHWVFESF